MANKIVVGASYFEGFDNGQGIGASNYFDYAPDFNTNFATIRTTINQMIDEITATQGQNSVLGLDLMRVDGPDFSNDTDGVIGYHSYITTIGAPTSEVDVTAGQAVVSGLRVASGSPASLVGFGGAATLEVFVQSDGVPDIAASTPVGSLHIADAVWDGAAFTDVTRVGYIFNDGDAHQQTLARPATGDFALAQFEHPGERFEALEAVVKDPAVQPRFEVTRATTQSIGASTNETIDNPVAISWTANPTETPSGTPPTGWITPSSTDVDVPTDQDGWYVITGRVTFDGVAAATDVISVGIYINGSMVARDVRNRIGTATPDPEIAVTWQGPLVATDTITLEVTQDNAASQDINSAEMSGIRIWE